MRLSDLPILNPATADLPKYRQIAAVLEEYLQRANLPEGERFFSDRALAKRFSTTSVTISHSLNYLVSKGLLSRKAGSGTYVGKQFFERKSQRSIGIVCHEMISSDENYCIPVLRKFGAFFEKHSFECISFKSEPADWRRLITDYMLDGLMVFVPKAEFAPEIFKLRAENVPVVSVGYAIPELPGISFGTNHVEAMNMAVDYMYQLGHRKIAFLFYSSQASSRVFLRSYRQAMWEHQLPLNPMWEITLENDDGSGMTLMEHEEIKNQLLKLRESGNMPTAILIKTLIDAVSFYNFAAQNDLKIPEDISLITFDESPFVSQLNPPLTVIAQDLDNIAVNAAQTLLAMINGSNEVRTVPTPPVFIQRGSCAVIKDS